jgi:Holliday junction resolvase RusA-like endonuclease
VGSVSFTVFGPPVPKARARRGKGGRFYTPEKTRRYETAVGWAARAAKNVAHVDWPMDATYRMTCAIYMPDNRRRDGSNVLKSLEDGCIGVLFDDDCQVESCVWSMALDRENPRVDVTVEVLGVAA